MTRHLVTASLFLNIVVLGAASPASAQGHQRIVVEFAGPAGAIDPTEAPIPSYVLGFDSCSTGPLTNIETGKPVGSIVECTKDTNPADGPFGETEFVQFFELQGGSIVSMGLGGVAVHPGPMPAGSFLQLLTGITPVPDVDTFLESTGRFQGVRRGQVRLSGFLNVTASGLDVNCIFVIDLYRGRP